MHPILAAALATPLSLLVSTAVQAQQPPVPAPTAAAQPVHVVSAGETLSTIADRYGSTVAAFALVNDIADIDLIRVGQVLAVPPPPPRDAVLHVVAAGDTLNGIAALHGVEPGALAAANDLTLTTLIFPGDVLIVPV